MAIKMTSFLPEVGKFKLQIIILSLEPGAEPCDFHSFPSWSILLWLLVKYQGSRSVRCAEMHLHKLDAPTPGSFINSLICKESKAPHYCMQLCFCSNADEQEYIILPTFSHCCAPSVDKETGL